MGNDALSLALYGLKEEAKWAWQKSVAGEHLDLPTLQRSWDQVVHVIMQQDNNRCQHDMELVGQRGPEVGIWRCKKCHAEIS